MKARHPTDNSQEELSYIKREASWRHRASLVPLFLALLAYGLAAVLEFRNMHHFDGDEPHYVLMAESLCRDGDADLRNNYEAQNYLAFFPRQDFKPHAYDYRGNGELRSVHSVGLPILLILPHCIFGHPYWARIEMALLAALASWSIFVTIRDWTKDPRLAYATWAFITFTMPMWVFAPQVYPDVVAVLAVAVALQLFLSRHLTLGKVLGLGLIVSLLPWLHARFTVLSLLIVTTTGVRLIRARIGWKAYVCLSLPPAISGLLWMWNSYVWYGGILPNAGYGPWSQYARLFWWDRVYNSLANLALGREFGLVTYAPVYLLALVGLVMMVVHRQRVIVAPLTWLLGYVLAVVLSQSVYQIDQGYSFPARMLLPATPLLALPLAYSIWRARWLRIVGLALFLVSMAMSVQSLVHPYQAIANQNGVSELPLLKSVQRIYPALQYILQETEVDLTRTDRLTGRLAYDQMTDSPVVLADPLTDEPGLIILGPYLAFQTGQYIATVALSSRDANPTAVVAHIDIVADEGNRVLADRQAYAHEFLDGSQPRAFSLPFFTKDTWPIRVRIYYAAQSRLSVHSIHIAPQTRSPSDPCADLPIVLGWLLLVLIFGLLAAGRTGPTNMEFLPHEYPSE
jgi:hypothetical protein